MVIIVIRMLGVFIITLSLFVCVIGQEAETKKLGMQPIATAEEAIEKAMLYTGFDKQSIVPEGMLSASAELAVIEEDVTPFLSDSIIGKTVWKVVVTGVRFDLPDWTWVNSQPMRTFEVLIDSATGRLFGAYSYYNGYDPDMAPESPSDTVSKLMAGATEVFVGFPTKPPPITLAQAMNKAIGSSPIRAKELLCICVMRTYLRKQAKPVWSIIGRGMPPFDLHGTDRLRPMYQRNRWRTLVDATTGSPMSIDNQPPLTISREEMRKRQVRKR